MTEQEMKLLYERMKKEDPKLLVLMEKCFDAGVLSGKEQAQRKPWVWLTDDERNDIINQAYDDFCNRRVIDTDIEISKAIEAKLREKNAAPCKPLTDAEIEKICPKFEDPVRREMWVLGFKAAHGIKGDA